jgi:hypothetical protein
MSSHNGCGDDPLRPQTVVNPKEQTMPYLPPLFIDINVSPVTKVATVTQTANAFSLGSLSSVAVASNVASITQ